MLTKKQYMIMQYNQGIFTFENMKYWLNKGYAFVCADGKLNDIVYEGV